MSNEENKDMDLVAVDIGFGYVKAISDNTKKQAMFAAGVGKPVDDKTGNLFGNNTSEQKQSDNIHIEMNTEEWFVGELAKKQSPNFFDPLSGDRHTSNITVILLNVAIQLVTDSDNINLVTGLPFEQYASQKEELKQTVLGNQPSIKWHAGEKKGEKRSVNVEKVMILPQAMSALFTVLFDENSKPKRPDLMEEGTTIGLIDVGHKTTDYVFLEIGEGKRPAPVDDKSSTVEAGGVNIENAISEKFTRETGETDMSQRNLKKAYRSGKIKYSFKGEAARNIEFSDEIENQKNFVADQIFEKINNNWGAERNTLDELYFVGGGSILYYEELQERFDRRLKQIENNQFANVYGYLWYGRNVLANQKQNSQDD